MVIGLEDSVACARVCGCLRLAVYLRDRLAYARAAVPHACSGTAGVVRAGSAFSAFHVQLVGARGVVGRAAPCWRVGVHSSALGGAHISMRPNKLKPPNRSRALVYDMVL